MAQHSSGIRVVLVLVVVGVAVIALLPSGSSRTGRVVWASPVPLTEAVATTPSELSEALYLYVMFLGIDHDEWFGSEATKVRSSIELSGLAAAGTEDDLLARFPKILENVGAGPLKIRRLQRGRPGFMEGAVIVAPAEGRIELLHGEQYIEDGYGEQVALLEGGADCTFAIELIFSPGDYDDAGDLNAYALKLSGSLKNGELTIGEARGRLASTARLRALLSAAALVSPVDPKRLTFASAKEASQVDKLMQEVAPGQCTIEHEDGSYYVEDNTFDAAILLGYVRHGKAALHGQPDP